MDQGRYLQNPVSFCGNGGSLIEWITISHVANVEQFETVLTSCPHVRALTPELSMTQYSAVLCITIALNLVPP